MRLLRIIKQTDGETAPEAPTEPDLSGSECTCSRGRNGSRALCERKRYSHGLQPQTLKLPDDGKQR